MKAFAGLGGGFVRRGFIGLLVAATLGVSSRARAVSEEDAGRLLMPFAFLYSTDEGKTALQQSYEKVLEVQNFATPALQNLAMHDATRDLSLATSMANGFGQAFQSAYFGAIYAGDSNVPAIQNFLQAGISVADDGSDFAKTFFGTGSVSGYSLAIPAGGNADVYGLAFVPADQRQLYASFGNPRPFLVTQYHPPDQIVTFNAPTFVSPASNLLPPPVGPVSSNTVENQGVETEAAFSSGHTTYAYASAILFSMMMPEGYQMMMSRADAFANSRLVMGAHYATDLIGGRTVATYFLANWLSDPANRTLMASATTSLRALLAEGYTSDTGPELWSYDASTARQEFLDRMTYGITPIGPTDRPMVVPENAHYLLATRFPYMTVDQRNEVLRTTAHASGGPLDNTDPAYRDWDRINLFDAAGGFGAIDSDITITMDASAGGLNAADEWNNTIGGIGELTKDGTGALLLSGNNTFGGVHVTNGTVNLTGTNSFSKATSVGGAGRKALLDVSGATVAKTIDVQPLGVLNVSGTVSANDDFKIQGGADNGIVNVYVSGNNQLKAGADGSGDFVNDGTITLYTSPGLAAGNYTPIAAGGTSGSISGTGTIDAYGASWDSGTATLVVGDASHVHVHNETQTGTITNENVSGKRYEFERDGNPFFIIGFNSSSGTIDFSATELDLTAINGQAVLMAFDFDTTLSSGETMLSYSVGVIANPGALTLWHLADGATEWTIFTPDYSVYEGEWYSFKTDGFSSYAVTVPEPSSWALLACGGAALIVWGRRKRSTVSSLAA